MILPRCLFRGRREEEDVMLIAAEDASPAPAILVFSTHNISDPGIDLAGSSHMHYSSRVSVIALPCSSAVKSSWILHAFEQGFSGVFIAADGTDCAYLGDCTTRTAALLDATHALMGELGITKSRLKMAAICSVCAESFAAHMNSFAAKLAELDAAERASSRQA